MAVLSNTTVTSIRSATAAVDADHCVRLGELTSLLADKSDTGHTHPASEITNFVSQAQASTLLLVLDSDSVNWVYDSGDNKLFAHVRLKTGGGIVVDGDGLSLSGVPASEHTHEELHDAATVADSDTLDLSIAGQEISGAVRLKSSGGLLSDGDGVFLDFGTGANQAAPGNHTHAQLHAAVTVQNTSSVALNLSAQDLTATVRRETSPGSSGIALGLTSNGIFVPTGTSSTVAARGNHTHANASQASDGMMSAADKRKLDSFTTLAQTDQPVLYHRHDYVVQDQYVGGLYRWGQRMEVTGANLVARAPANAHILELEVDDVLTGVQINIPGGPSNEEVVAAVDLENVFIESGEFARWLCVSGVSAASEIEDAASMVSLAMNVRPALDTIPTLALNAGGTAAGGFVDDAHFDGGATQFTLAAVNTAGVTNPAPQGVYQTARGFWQQSTPQQLVYLVPGLAVGIDYTVRLHFAEFIWDFQNESVFDIEVRGATTQTHANYDIIAQADEKFRAVIREFTLRADSSGQIRVTLTAKLTAAEYYNLSINGIEIVAD